MQQSDLKNSSLMTNECRLMKLIAKMLYLLGEDTGKGCTIDIKRSKKINIGSKVMFVTSLTTATKSIKTCV